jgi:putative hydrolase of the HAD superfamily
MRAGVAAARHYTSRPAGRQPSQAPPARRIAQSGDGVLLKCRMQIPARGPPASNDIDVVLFDAGGVLVEVQGIAAILEWLEHRVTAEDVWRLWFASPAVRAFESGRIGPEEFAASMLAELQLDMSASAFLDAFVTWPVRLYPGTLDLIARIPRRYRRALLSNTNALHWPRIVEELGLGAGFDHCFASHLMGKIKPDRDAFEHAVAALDCEPSRILFLDDNLPNIETARALGLHALRVRGLEEARRALEDCGILRNES